MFRVTKHIQDYNIFFLRNIQDYNMSCTFCYVMYVFLFLCLVSFSTWKLKTQKNESFLPAYLMAYFLIEYELKEVLSVCEGEERVVGTKEIYVLYFDWDI